MTNVIWLCTKKWNSNDVKMSFPPFHSPPLSIISFIKFLCWLFSLLPYHGRDQTIVFALVSFLKSAPVASTCSLIPSLLSNSNNLMCFFLFIYALPFHLTFSNVLCSVIFCTQWQQDNVQYTIVHCTPYTRSVYYIVQCQTCQIMSTKSIALQ